MRIKTFKQLIKGIKLDYFAEDIEEPLDLDLLLEQLDILSGITSVDCYFEGIPSHKISNIFTDYLTLWNILEKMQR